MDYVLLERAGRALYGDGWITPLCADAAWSRRFIERIASGQNPAPRYVFVVLATLVGAKIVAVRALLEDGPDASRAERLLTQVDGLSDIAKELARFAHKAISAA